jgi:4-amino-4-deoxy-L-arabinose transferase-like glycosyltransferase
MVASGMFKRLLNHPLLTPDRRWILGLTLAAIVLWTINLGNLPLRDWDEGTHAMVARELTRQNNWLHLTLLDQPYLRKPPLAHWLVSVSYRLFGQISEFSGRLPLALITALGVPGLYAVTRELTPCRRDAILTASVYLTLLPVVRHGRLLMLDGLINTLLIVAILCVLKARQSQAWGFGIGLSLAAIALTKGAMALALGGILGVYVCWGPHRHLLKNPYVWFGLGLGTSLVLGWYWIQWQSYGDRFIQGHLGAQNFPRLSTAVEGNAGPPWYYLAEILRYTFPWLLFWPGGLWLAWQ